MMATIPPKAKEPFRKPRALPPSKRYGDNPQIVPSIRRSNLSFSCAKSNPKSSQRQPAVTRANSAKKEYLPPKIPPSMAEEKIKGCGHQQDDDTIWCNMDEILKVVAEVIKKKLLDE